MDKRIIENMAMRIITLEEEIKEAKETLWQMMVKDIVEEQIDSAAAYVRYLENDYKKMRERNRRI